MKLDVWTGDWGLPSIDPDCLAVLAYCKFSGAPVDVSYTGNTWRSPSGTLPVLRNEDVVHTKVPDIFSYLRKEHWGSDSHISGKESADTVAFSAMLEEKIVPAMLHLWWLDEKTYTDITRPWYAKVIPFPLTLFVPWRLHKSAEMRVTLTKGSEHITDGETETKIYREAKECLNILSYKLGTNAFFFGNSPSSLDARVFGYLATLMKVPLRNHPLQVHLKQCDNLMTFVSNILTTYFPNDIKAYEEKIHEQEEEQKTKSADYSDYPDRRRNMILAGVFALTVMVGYAVNIGLLQVQIFDEDCAPSKRNMTLTNKKNPTTTSSSDKPAPSLGKSDASSGTGV